MFCAWSTTSNWSSSVSVSVFVPLSYFLFVHLFAGLIWFCSSVGTSAAWVTGFCLGLPKIWMCIFKAVRFKHSTKWFNQSCGPVIEIWFWTVFWGFKFLVKSGRLWVTTACLRSVITSQWRCWRQKNIIYSQSKAFRSYCETGTASVCLN